MLIHYPSLVFAVVSKVAVGLTVPANRSLLQLPPLRQSSDNITIPTHLDRWPPIGTPVIVPRTSDVMFNITLYGASYADPLISYVADHLDTISEMILRHRPPRIGPEPQTYTSGDVTLQVMFLGTWTVEVEDLYNLVMQLVEFTENSGVRGIELGRFGPPDGRGRFESRAIFQLAIDMERFAETSKERRSNAMNDSVLQLPSSIPSLPTLYNETIPEFPKTWPNIGTVVRVDPKGNNAVVSIGSYGPRPSPFLIQTVLQSLIAIWEDIYHTPHFAGPTVRLFAHGQVRLQVVFRKDWRVTVYEFSLFVTMLYFLTQVNGPREIAYGEIGTVTGRGAFKVHGDFNLKILGWER